MPTAEPFISRFYPFFDHHSYHLFSFLFYFFFLLSIFCLSLQSRCTTSQSASTCLTPRWFAASPGGRTPTSAGFTSRSPSLTPWGRSPRTERLWLWPRLPSAATSPARSATNWATAPPHTLQVQADTILFLCSSCIILFSEWLEIQSIFQLIVLLFFCVYPTNFALVASTLAASRWA